MVLLDELPIELLLHIFEYLDVPELCRLKRCCRKFNYIISSWDHRLVDVTTVVTNQKSPRFYSKCLHHFSTLEKMRITRNWTYGRYSEKSLMYIKHKTLPWIHMNSEYLWFSRGRDMMCFERNNSGVNVRRPVFSLQTRGNEDIVNFKLSRNILVCGLREGAIWLVDLNEKKTISEVEHCHSNDVSSIDINQQGNLIASGSKDNTLKIWELTENATLKPIEAHCQVLEDFIWKVSLSDDSTKVAVGTSGKTHMSSIFVHDIERPASQIINLGCEIYRDKGISDLKWDGEQTLWSCGYNSCLKRWDLRTGRCEQSMMDPHGSGLYCMDYDYYNSIIVGTQMHGRAILWDVRQSKLVQMYFMGACKSKRYRRSSPIYGLAFDSEFLFTATDQNLNVLKFNVFNGIVRDYSFSAF